MYFFSTAMFSVVFILFASMQMSGFMSWSTLLTREPTMLTISGVCIASSISWSSCSGEHSVA
eukprot:CAMPEP_0175477700 /NCGR_PEP_ID=MMETSP0095-20121207/76563_1 /TAXON_ID=311494 /ORGANISM="Alexandrium monilatum, Strain CCMP3105" /LENGTH=61 /DNA_ID=CAMNT_0016779297 /DNA_START=61 /DNA_END=242 /DNA_ORIENTATION=+